MIPTLACVLRSGGEYRSEHVVALYRGVQQHWPVEKLGYLHMICLTDMNFLQFGVDNVKLVGDWPGWWAKMELFRPDLPARDLLYIDLDTVIVGELVDMANVGHLTVLRDLYHAGKPERQASVGSGLMYLPESCRKVVWERWLHDPQGHIARHRKGGDQKFLQEVLGAEADRWQDILPNQVVSYKIHVRGAAGKVPTGARVVCFHGPPRPWEVPPLIQDRDENDG